MSRYLLVRQWVPENPVLQLDMEANVTILTGAAVVAREPNGASALRGQLVFAAAGVTSGTVRAPRTCL